MNRWQHPWRVLVVPYYLNRYARQVHVLRVLLAFLLGLALVIFSGIPHGGWMLVTILIVLGGVPHWGGVRRKALERMDEVAATTPALAEDRSPRRAIVRTLLRAAHALRFNQPQLLADPLPAADNPARMRQPTHCHWLVAELSLTVEALRCQLQEILPRLIEAPPPARSLVRRLSGSRRR
jgi:hypothetical protein